MVEPEPKPQVPFTDPPPPTASVAPARILDVAAVEATGAYPDQATATFAPSPRADHLPTVTAAPGPLDDTEPDPEEHLPQITGYRVVRKISSGGMGTVFKAVHLGLNKVMAVKLINSGWAADSDFRIRFERETKTLAQLEHPNIVPVYDAGLWQGLPYLVMKYVPGQTLYHHLPALRQDLPAACRVMIQVARAVAYLHSRNIIHRDLKPLNILMTAEGVPLVADFGLVRPIADELDISITIMPLEHGLYMSPEQTYGGKDNYTAACDIWAIGVILYELLAGSLPFVYHDRNNHAELFRLIRFAAPPPLPADVPPGLEAIVWRCLQKSVADRYQTAEAVAVDLECWLAGIAIDPVARPAKAFDPSAPTLEPLAPAAKPPRRYRRVLLAGVLLAMASFSGGLPYTPPAIAPLPPRTITERLNAGETIWVQREKGLPHVKYRTLPGTYGTLTTEYEGHLTLTSAGMLALEFDTGPLPPSFRLEGEVGLIVANENWSFAGLFAGGKETPDSVGQQHQTVVQLVQQNSFQRDGDKNIVTEKASLELHRWQDRAPQDRTSRGSKSLTTHVVLDKKAELVWHKFALVIGPGQITGQWRDELVGFWANDPAVKMLNNTFRMTYPKVPPPFQPPAFGAGLGLCVNNATAVFRNVRLIPNSP